MFDVATMPALVLATFAGYLFGSVPVGVLVSRMQGVDIFSTGSGLPGAANVYRNVGHASGMLVFAADAVKGALAIVVAHRFGVGGEMILIPALATVVGHWRPVFTRFRGGDSLSTLVGVTVAIFPIYGLLALITSGVVATIAKITGHHATLWGGSAGYGFLLVRAPATEGGTTMVLGVVILALLVLAHVIVGHRRRVTS